MPANTGAAQVTFTKIGNIFVVLSKHLGSSIFAFHAGTCCLVRLGGSSMSTPSAPVHDWAVGDRFTISGPFDCWHPGKVGGWQPRAWWSQEDDPASRLVDPQELFINFVDA